MKLGRATGSTLHPFTGQLDNDLTLTDKSIVISRFGHLLLIVALLGATGAHWAMLQSVAWATMLADNARVSSFPEAFEKTFDGKHPCALCQQIAKGRQSEKKSDVQTELRKLEFFHQSIAILVNSPVHFIMLAEASTTGPLLTQSPPVPPPRAFSV